MKVSNLTSNQKKWGTRGIITFVILALAIPLYKSRDRNRKDVRQSKEQIVDLDKHTFEDSILAQTQAEIRELRSSIDDFKEDYLKNFDDRIADHKVNGCFKNFDMVLCQGKDK